MWSNTSEKPSRRGRFCRYQCLIVLCRERSSNNKWLYPDGGARMQCMKNQQITESLRSSWTPITTLTTHRKSPGVIFPILSFSSFASRNPARTIWRSIRLAVLDGQIVCPGATPISRNAGTATAALSQGKMAATGRSKRVISFCTRLPPPCRGDRLRRLRRIESRIRLFPQPVSADAVLDGLALKSHAPIRMQNPVISRILATLGQHSN